MGKTNRLDNRKVVKHPVITGDATLDTTIKVELDNKQSIGEPDKQLQAVYARNIESSFNGVGSSIGNINSSINTIQNDITRA
jgi:hypothetical protein